MSLLAQAAAESLDKSALKQIIELRGWTYFIALIATVVMEEKQKATEQ